jgi:hypothetical protein
MPKEKSIAHREDKIANNSSSSDVDDYKSLDAYQKQARTTWTPTHNASLSSAMPQY